MVKKTCLGMLVGCILAATILVPGCSLTPERRITLHYGFCVDPIGNEEVRDFHLYLPFPCHKKKALRKGLHDLLQNDRLYHRSQEPAEYSIVTTKHGPMLEVTVPLLKRGVGAGFEIGITEEMSASEYYLWRESGNHLHPYLYEPRFEIRTKGKQRYAHTYIYSEGQGGRGCRLEMRYDISDRIPAPFPFTLSHGGGGDLLAFFGIEEPPDPIPGSAGVPVELREFGWTKIPVTECE